MFRTVALGLSMGMALVSGLATAASVEDVAWLAGSWRGEAFGGTFEETWNPPSGGTMVGLFKLLEDGEVKMYEIMRIAEVEGRVVLEVKHFSADFVAWEDKAEAVRFPLEEATPERAAFAGLIFTRQEDGTVTADLSMKSPAGETRVERLLYRPVRP